MEFFFLKRVMEEYVYLKKYSTEQKKMVLEILQVLVYIFV